MTDDEHEHHEHVNPYLGMDFTPIPNEEMLDRMRSWLHDATSIFCRRDAWTEPLTTADIMDSVQRLIAQSRYAARKTASDRQKVNDLIRQNPRALAHILANGRDYPLRSAQTNEGGEVIRPAMLYGVPLDPDVVEMVKLEVAFMRPSVGGDEDPGGGN